VRKNGSEPRLQHIAVCKLCDIKWSKNEIIFHHNACIRNECGLESHQNTNNLSINPPLESVVNFYRSGGFGVAQAQIAAKPYATAQIWSNLYSAYELHQRNTQDYINILHASQGELGWGDEPPPGTPPDLGPEDTVRWLLEKSYRLEIALGFREDKGDVIDTTEPDHVVKLVNSNDHLIRQVAARLRSVPPIGNRRKVMVLIGMYDDGTPNLVRGSLILENLADRYIKAFNAKDITVKYTNLSDPDIQKFIGKRELPDGPFEYKMPDDKSGIRIRSRTHRHFTQIIINISVDSENWDFVPDFQLYTAPIKKEEVKIPVHPFGNKILDHFWFEEKGCYRIQHTAPNKSQIGKANDRLRRNQFIQFGKIADTLLTACLMSRCKEGETPDSRAMRRFKTHDIMEWNSLLQLQKIMEFLADQFNDQLLNKVAGAADRTAKLVKDASAELRVIWQRAKSKEITPGLTVKLSELSFSACSPLTELILCFLSYLEDPTTSPPTRFDARDGVYSLPSYNLAMMGFVGRGLPEPSANMVTETLEETYLSFLRPTHKGDEEMYRKEIREWSRTYWYRLPPRSLNGTMSSSATIERGRDDGGFTSYLRDLYQYCNSQPLENLPAQLRTWKEQHQEVRALQTLDDLAIRKEYFQSFTRALALSVLKPYLDHVPHCKRENCRHPSRHLPVSLSGIPELGNKVRVPCLTTSLLNHLLEPIRAAMFTILRKDKRCAFRLKGVEKRRNIKAFLERFDTSELIHSGDLTTSTDKFPFFFMEETIKGMFDVGAITDLERDIMLMATGPYLICDPKVKSNELNSVRFQDSIKSINMHFKAVRNDAQMQGRKKNGIWTVNNYIPLTPDLDYSKKTFYIDLIERYKLVHPNAKLIRYPEASVRQGFSAPIKDHVPEGFNERNFLQEATDFLEHPWVGYLSRVGLQMGTSISIALLYGFNIFCDERAYVRSGGKGRSLLCGDDSLRIGNYVYIYTYRDTVSDLGGIWSKTKDVVGEYPRGIFTEIAFEDNDILLMPKVKTVVRHKERNGPPAWQTAIPGIHSLKAVTPGIENALIGDIKRRFPHLYLPLPLSTPKPIGLGEKHGQMGEADQRMWENIKRVKDPHLALRLLSKFSESFTVRECNTEPIQEVVSFITPLLPRAFGTSAKRAERYKRGEVMWLKEVQQKIRAGIAETALLEAPSRRRFFAGSVDYAKVMSEHTSNLNDCASILNNHDCLELHGGRNKSLYDFLPTDEQFIEFTLHADIEVHGLKNLLGEDWVAQ